MVSTWIARELGVRFELEFLFFEVVIRFGLLERVLTVLSNQRCEEQRVEIDKVHGAGKRRDLVGESQLDVVETLRLLFQHYRMMQLGLWETDVSLDLQTQTRLHCDSCAWVASFARHPAVPCLPLPYKTMDFGTALRIP